MDALRKTQRKLQISKKNFTEFSRQMLSIREEERKNLSMNLHDELGSMAVSLGAKLSVAEDEMKNNNSQGAVEALVQMKAMLKQSVGRIRKISVDLRPPDLDIIGLPDALRNYCKNTTDQTGIAVDCKVDLDGHKISDDTAIVIYRVTQEAINNIIRHSGAKKAVLELKYRTDNMHFNIQDDGKGFDIKDKLHRTKEAKMGLQGMKERIESLGGTFAITSAPKKGSNISVTLPCFIEEES
jgi:two-component system sensor histidine kinase DegS